ncbi:hypothetical protein Pmani_029884 [Petrolisthes manimaculis]|uniref:Uncharacterized protein n=1 Tax=Petrolisthes manimaculis TaxID=1843537 RepID=A0AAE1NYJ3_9EUCA|nr:hypothetical protein Pmani_029884 [Petrolisthes manimaculis]
MMIAQFIVAVMGVVCVLLFLTNSNLRQSLANQAQVSERSIADRNLQLQTCHDQLNVISTQKTAAEDIYNHVVKETDKYKDEVNQLYNKITELKKKEDEANTLKKSLKEAQAHEKDLESKLHQAEENLKKAEEAQGNNEKAKKAKKAKKA